MHTSYAPYSPCSLPSIPPLVSEKGGMEATREALLAFHTTYYSADIMKLAIVGREDLDTLQVRGGGKGERWRIQGGSKERVGWPGSAATGCGATLVSAEKL